MLRAALLTLIMLPHIALSQDEFRDDFASLDAWEAQPHWLGARASQPFAEARDGVAHFRISEANRGMKWRRELPQVDAEFGPWLVIRYRAEGYAADRVDYVLWLGDSGRGRDGLRLMTGDHIRAEGQWHTRAFDLEQAGVVSPLNAMAVQCFADDGGDASLWVDYIAFTDSPPDDAEGYEAPLDDGRTWEVPVDAPEDWTVQPTWLANYTTRSHCEATPAGTRFVVEEPGRGAKWSRDLPEAIREARWVSLRYRATGMRGGTDYALYVGSEPGGRAREEQYIITLGDIIPDNTWRVATARAEVSSVKTLAAQVQARAESASLEIARLTFHEARPVIRLADEFDCAQGWPADMRPFRPVTLPPGNLDGPGLARKLKCEGWIPEGPITAQSIPFTVRPGGDAVLMTALREPGEIALEPEGRAAEVYLLLAAQLPGHEEPAFGGGRMSAIRQVERFAARIEYADGTAEEQFPLQVSRREHQLARGLHVYALALEPEKDVARIVLRDGMRRGAFGLVAATVSDNPGPATEATAPRPALSPPTERPVAARRAGITRAGERIIVEAWTLTMVLDCSDGLRVVAAENHSYHPAPLEIEPGPLFRLESGDLRLTSEDFRVTDIRGQGASASVDMVWEGEGAPIRVTVTADTDDPREVGLRASWDLGGRDHVATRLHFPDLQGMGFGGDAEDNWYWMPRRGDVISNLPLSLRAPYAGAGNPLQVIGAFSPRAGTGLYLMTQDLEATPRFYHVAKAGGRVRLGVEWHPFEGGDTPRTVLGCTPGGWQAQLDRYREWLATWYRPAAPRKQWFREVFNFRQDFLHFALPVKSGMFDPETKTFRIREVVEQDIEAFGGVDYLHIFDWGWDPVRGRCGDYDPWDYLGGADNLKAAVQEVKDMGIPVGLYIEGYLVDQQSNLGKAHGAQWQLLDLGGEPYTFFAPSFHICPWVKDWQDYLAATYARARQQTGAVGFYIDQFGFSHHYHCTNPAHGHPIPVTPVLGERETTRRVREAVGPEAAVYTEESPTDVNSQFQDGSFTYNISSVPDEWSPTHINLYRFAMPDFKTIEIIVCDKPLGSNVEAVKRILFNGEAIWIEGIWDRWFTPEVRDYIARMNRVLRENRAAFSGDFPRPLVPTRVEGIYANMFPEEADGSGKTCWTVYNTNFRTARGELMSVEHLPGAVYRDELSGEEIPVRVEGETAVLSLDMGPRDVAVISRSVTEP